MSQPVGILHDPHIEQIAQRIAEEIQPQKIILFGSHAKGTAQDRSDVDLLLIYDGSLSKSEVHLRVLDLFDPYHFGLDLFILSTEEWEHLKPVANTLAREADETGIVCYG